MRLTSLPQYRRNAARFSEIVAILGKYGLAGWLKSSDPEFLKRIFKSKDGEGLEDRPRADRLRLALQDLGPTFIKIGQILSTRSDLIGPDYSAELENLQANVPPDQPEVVRRIIVEELGKPPEELFAEFDEEPLGSASIGQVHAARLKDGTEVVVKVQHPDIERTIHDDLDILETLAAVAEEFAQDLKRFQPRTTVREFRRILLRELDYGRELRNLDDFRRAFQGQPEVIFPEPMSEFSTQRVLTMTRLQGISLQDPDRIIGLGLDTKQLTRTGARVYLDMIFRDGFYHADPHPGNLLVMDGGALGMLDAGMTGRVGMGTRENLEGLLLAAVASDPEELTYFVTRIGSLPVGLDRNALQSDLSEFLAEYGRSSLEGFDMKRCLEDGIEIVRRHGVRLQPDISLLLKVLMMLEGTSRRLDRDFSLAEVLEPYFHQIAKRRFSPRENLLRLVRTARDWDRLARRLPRHINEILERANQGNFQISLEHRRLDRATNRLVFGILTASLFLGSAMLMSGEIPPRLFGVSVFGVVGTGVAVVLMIILLRAIHHSGDME